MNSLRAQRGLTLIELMLSLTIGLVMTLALFGVILGSESRKRVNTGLNDLEQAGNIAMYQLDQWVRSAGSGFGAIANYGYGCALRAKSADGRTLPFRDTLPAPFAAVNPDGSGNFALAPLLILPASNSSGTSQEASDMLVVMGGAAGLGGAPNVMTQAPAAGALTLNNTVAFAANDLLLVADPNGGSTTTLTPCMLTQVSSSFTNPAGGTSLPLAGSFYAATLSGRNLADYSANAVGLPLGAPVTNPPQFMLIGVGAHDTLFTYDLLQTGGATAALQARAQGIYEMHALYGVDNNGDGRMDSWVSGAAGAFAPANLLPGAVGANALLRRILAVRVALVLRMPLAEKAMVSPDSLVLFPELAGDSLSITRSLTDDQRRYRYRVVESTLVLRNNLLGT